MTALSDKEAFIGDINEIKPDVFRRAYSAAISKLSIRDHSRSEIKKTLALKGFEESVSDQVIKKLENDGYLKENEFAERLAKNQLEKGYGRFQIRLKMNAKGFDEDVLDHALESSCSREKEYESALSSALKKLKTLIKEDPAKKRVKLSRFLVSRGFDYDLTREVVNKVLAQYDSFGE